MSKSGNFIERSIVEILSFLKESLFADEYASRKGFLQSLDPMIKAVSFIFFIIQVLLTAHISVVLSFYVFCLLLAQSSKIDLLFFLKRTWIFIPLFSLFIAIPALFSTISPGETWITFTFLGRSANITHQGVLGASLFVARVITSVSYAILLSITTRHFELLRVLRIFKIPQVFVMIAGMCYRYVYLFVEIIEKTHLAIKSRVGTSLHYKKGQHIVAWNIASLWSRSYYLNEAVYQAMLSRGYRGEPVVLHDFKLRVRDWVWLIAVALISFCVWGACYWLKG